MADLGISEFTFEFSFLYEQTFRNWGNLVTYPLLPNLIDEKNVGWDAMLHTKGAKYYYQFKRSELLSRSNAKHISNGPYGSSYFRINLHKGDCNMQHRLLWEWAQKSGNSKTYYVAPEITSQSEFKASFLNHTVVDHSRLIPLINCRNYDPDDRRQHYITYQHNVAGFLQFSESYKGKGDFFGKDIGNSYEKGRNEFVKIDEEYANNSLEEAINFTRKLPNKYSISEYPRPLRETKPDTIISKLLQSANILWIALGIVTILVLENREASL
jgi:hypothetical protein